MDRHPSWFRPNAILSEKSGAQKILRTRAGDLPMQEGNSLEPQIIRHMDDFWHKSIYISLFC